jgi:hypothetical protein
MKTDRLKHLPPAARIAQVRPYDLAGPRIKIEQPAGPDGWFNVEVSGGWGDAGECWKGVLWKDANGWHVQPTSYCRS